ncbi:MAG: hypothetical protein IJA54_08275 [Tyzzerella sp.]|nr:hypothetical protein [Tyzzerella sp.]
MKTAILVDGGFYRRRAYAAYGDRTPTERADDLFEHIDGLRTCDNAFRPVLNVS